MIMDGLALPAPLPGARCKTSGRSPQKPMDEAKFEAFYKRTAGNVWSYLFRLTGNSATADDLLQKTYFRYLRSNPSVESEEQRRAYLFRTATNLVFDHFRESKRERQRASEIEMSGQVHPERSELRHDMMRAFGELKPQERALLWLAHVEESSHDEIGQALGVKSKSVRVLLFRARKRLGELLTKRGLGPEVAP
jgi:RNA polymerase sigma-70 factor (ECF subfamily)